MTVAAEAKSFLERLEEDRTVRPFPSSAARLMEATQNPDCECRDLVGIIECDPGYAAQLLAMANSSMYGFGGRVRTIEHAVVLLGFRAVRDLAISMAGAEVFSSGDGALAERRRLWHHSLACALTSRLLAQQLDGLSPDEAFLGGVFHDVGKLLFFDHVADAYIELERSLPADELFDRIIDEEQLAFGTTHQELGMDCAEDWGLPAEIQNAIGYHHTPDDAPEGFELAELTRASNRLVLVWQLADADSSAESTSSDAESESEATNVDLSGIDLPLTTDLINQVEETVRPQFTELRQLCGC